MAPTAEEMKAKREDMRRRIAEKRAETLAAQADANAEHEEEYALWREAHGWRVDGGLSYQEIADAAGVSRERVIQVTQPSRQKQ